MAEPNDIDAADMSPGTIVGRYVVLGRRDTGAIDPTEIAVTALDPDLSRPVSLKLRRAAPAGAASDAPEQLARLRSRAQAMARLTHRNTVAVYDVDVADGWVYLATELVRGADLRAWLAQRPRSVAELVEVFEDVAAGLGAAHAVGLVHGDVRAEHIVISDDGRVCIGEFGLADAAPAVDAREDQRAFCVALAEAVAGRAHAPWLRAIVRRGAADDPERRFSTMLELRLALRRGRTRRRRWAWSAGAGAAGAAIALAATRPTATPCPPATPAGWERFDRDAIVDRFMELRPTYGDVLGAWVADGIADARARWQAAHTEVCTATIRGEQSEARLDARMGCLGRVWERVAVVVDAVVVADAALVDHAIAVVLDLPDAERCIDEGASTSASDDAPQPVEQGLARAHLHRALGRDIEAELDALVSGLREHGDAATRVDALLLRDPDSDVGLAARHEAAVVAKTIDDPRLEAEAWIAVAEVTHDRDEARFYGELARASIDRHGHDDTLRAALEAALGQIELAAGRPDDAAARWTEALELRRAMRPVPEALVAVTLEALAAVELARNDRAAAVVRLEEAIELRTRLFGARHPSVAEVARALSRAR